MKELIAEKWKLLCAWVSTHGGWTRAGQFAIALVTMLHAFSPEFAGFFNWIWSLIPTHAKEPLVGFAAFYAWTRDPKNKAMVKQLFQSYFSQQQPDGTKTEELKSVETTTIQPPPAS